jgi:hypothetical protein
MRLGWVTKSHPCFWATKSKIQAVTVLLLLRRVVNVYFSTQQEITIMSRKSPVVRVALFERAYDYKE